MRPSPLIFALAMLAGCNSSQPGHSAEDGVTVDLPEPEATAVNAEDPANAVDTLNVFVPAVDEADGPDTSAKKEPTPPEIKTAPEPEAVPAEPSPPAGTPQDSASPDRKQPASEPENAKLLPARPPLSDGAIAATLARMRQPCGTITAANKVDTDAADGVYKVTCSSGDSYRGTDKGGHLFFRPWSDTRKRD